MANKSYSTLKGATASFNAMLRNFGVVTVMNAKIYDYDATLCDGSKKADEIYTTIIESTALAELKTLKIANVTMEGPTKTVTGGRYNNTLIKFGKTARLEIQDALGNADAIAALSGGVVEHYGETAHTTDTTDENGGDILHIGNNFSGPKTIVGESFFIDQSTGEQVPVILMFYQVLPDSLFNLSQDAEGDAAVFDMNSDLLMTEILVGSGDAPDVGGVKHGVFYSILSSDATKYTYPAA